MVDQTIPEQPANIYFEELPKPGDGHYLDHFLGSSKVWIRTIDQPAPSSVKAEEMKKDDLRWMKVNLPETKEFSIDTYGKFGVYAYGKKKVLLHYYARNLVVSTHEAVHEIGPAEQMNLDLVPHSFGDTVDVTLKWKGKPVPNRRVFIRGPRGFRRNLESDSKGRIKLESVPAGQYSIRSSFEEKTPGTEDGEAYELVRHNITMICQLPLED